MWLTAIQWNTSCNKKEKTSHIWMNLKNIMPDTRDHILYDSIHIKCPEKVNLYRKQISGYMGLEVGTKLTLNRCEKYYWDNDCSKNDLQ